MVHVIDFFHFLASGFCCHNFNITQHKEKGVAISLAIITTLINFVRGVDDGAIGGLTLKGALGRREPRVLCVCGAGYLNFSILTDTQKQIHKKTKDTATNYRVPRALRGSGGLFGCAYN